MRVVRQTYLQHSSSTWYQILSAFSRKQAWRIDQNKELRYKVQTRSGKEEHDKEAMEVQATYFQILPDQDLERLEQRSSMNNA